MPSVYLLRHCDYDNPRLVLAGRLPLELSQQGREQAERLRVLFKDKQIGKIYSSAVLRSKQTAEIISGGTIPIECDARLLETLSAYQGYWGDNWHGDGYHFFSHHDELGGENFTDIQERMADFWNAVVPGLAENIIICSHGDPLQLLYTHIQHQLPPAEDAATDDVPGWLEKGAFFEITFQNNTVKDIKSPVEL